MSPHRQGSIDQLCGIYAVLNSTRLVLAPKRVPSNLLSRCISALIDKKGTADFINTGTDITDIAHLLKMICKEYPIERSKPFHTKAGVSLDTYWKEAGKFLGEPNRAVIILFQTIYMGHWSVVRKADENKLYLFDSNGTKDLVRENCIMEQPTAAKHRQLFPTQTYYLTLNPKCEEV